MDIGKSVLVMRNAIIRPGVVTICAVKLVGVNKGGMVKENIKLLDNDFSYLVMVGAHNCYGDSLASMKIRKILEEVNL